jgi:hypothetical protein
MYEKPFELTEKLKYELYSKKGDSG